MGNKINFELIKTNFKLIIIPIVVVLLLGGIILYFSVNGQSKTVATYEQVWEAVENQGIPPLTPPKCSKLHGKIEMIARVKLYKRH